MPNRGHSALSAVTIRTARLLLRPHGIDDFGSIAAMGQMPEVYRYTSGRAATAEESWQRLLRYVGHWTCFGFGMFAVLDGLTGAFLGDVGAMDFCRGIDPEFGALPEMGWAFVPQVHGTGMAGEAVRAVLDWIDGGAGQAGTVCMINPEAFPSHRLAARVGYAETGRASYHDRPVTTYYRPAGATFAGPRG